MNLKEIETRKSEIHELLQGELTLEQVETLEKEVNEIEEERKSIVSALEKRNELIKATLSGKGEVVEENKKEERKMELDKIEVVSTPEYRSAYLKNLMGRDLSVEERALVTAATAIPTETFNQILVKLEQISALYPFISKSNIPGGLSLPRENANADASWVAMGTASTDSADSVDEVVLSAYKLIKTVEIGADVKVMAIPEFEAFIVNALAKKLSKAIENAIVNGTGAAQPTGLLKAGEITNVGTFTKLGMTFDDLVLQISDIGSEYRKNARFTMPSALYFSDVVPALQTAGIGVDSQDGLKFRVLGYEVVLNDNVPADTIIYGDFSYYHLNWAQPVAIEQDRSVGFRNGSVVYRGMGLADAKPTLAEAFNVYTRALA